MFTRGSSCHVIKLEAGVRRGGHCDIFIVGCKTLQVPELPNSIPFTVRERKDCFNRSVACTVVERTVLRLL